MSQTLTLVKREGNRYDVVLCQNSKYLLDVIEAKIKDGDGHYVLSVRSPLDNTSKEFSDQIEVGKISELEETLKKRALEIGNARALIYRVPLTDSTQN